MSSMWGSAKPTAYSRDLAATSLLPCPPRNVGTSIPSKGRGSPAGWRDETREFCSCNELLTITKVTKDKMTKKRKINATNCKVERL